MPPNQQSSRRVRLKQLGVDDEPHSDSGSGTEKNNCIDRSSSSFSYAKHLNISAPINPLPGRYSPASSTNTMCPLELLAEVAAQHRGPSHSYPRMSLSALSLGPRDTKQPISMEPSSAPCRDATPYLQCDPTLVKQLLDKLGLTIEEPTCSSIILDALTRTAEKLHPLVLFSIKLIRRMIDAEDQTIKDNDITVKPIVSFGRTEHVEELRKIEPGQLPFQPEGSSEFQIASPVSGDHISARSNEKQPHNGKHVESVHTEIATATRVATSGVDKRVTSTSLGDKNTTEDCHGVTDIHQESADLFAEDAGTRVSSQLYRFSGVAGPSNITRCANKKEGSSTGHGSIAKAGILGTLSAPPVQVSMPVSHCFEGPSSEHKQSGLTNLNRASAPKSGVENAGLEGRSRRRNRSSGDSSEAPMKKRKRVNWTVEDNNQFKSLVICLHNQDLDEAELRRRIAFAFRESRSHEQCANHLRILRAQGKLPQSKDDAGKLGERDNHGL